MGYPAQPYPQQAAPVGYPQQAPYPQPQPYQQQQSYQLQQPGYPQQQAPYPQPPAYGQQQPGYPQQPYPQQQPMPPASVNAFPAIDQAGTAFSGPQMGGMAGQALVNHQSLPNWLSGAQGQPGMGQAAPHAMSPSGMQARSLVDDQLLPKWLRDQPDDAGRANVSEWIGASAAQEPMPQFLSEAYAQAQVARAPQPTDNTFYQPPSPAHGSGYGGYGGGEDAAMPEWLRAQAQPGAGAGPQAGMPPAAGGAPQQPGGFAASDLIDPSALPDWVTGRAPAAQGFSGAQGWNAAEPGASLAAPEPTYQEGYDQQGYEQEYDQGQAQWGADSAQNDQGYGRGQPLASNELPPWLRGQAGASAAGGRMPSSERNPWASAAEPSDSAAAWDEAEPWDEGDGQAAQGWGAATWGDSRDGGRDDRHDSRRHDSYRDGHADGRMSGWGASEPNVGWEESAPQRARGGYADDRYDNDRYDVSQYGDDDDRDDDYDEEPADRAHGRGWLGFLRRDKR